MSNLKIRVDNAFFGHRSIPTETRADLASIVTPSQSEMVSLPIVVNRHRDHLLVTLAWDAKLDAIVRPNVEDSPNKSDCNVGFSLDVNGRLAVIWLCDDEVQSWENGPGVEIQLEPGEDHRQFKKPEISNLESNDNPGAPVCLADSDLTGRYHVPLAKLSVPPDSCPKWVVQELKVNGHGNAGICLAGPIHENLYELRYPKGNDACDLSVGEALTILYEIPGKPGQPKVDELPEQLDLTIVLKPDGELDPRSYGKEIYGRRIESWSIFSPTLNPNKALKKAFTIARLKIGVSGLNTETYENFFLSSGSIINIPDRDLNRIVHAAPDRKVELELDFNPTLFQHLEGEPLLADIYEDDDAIDVNNNGQISKKISLDFSLRGTDHRIWDACTIRLVFKHDGPTRMFRFIERVNFQRRIVIDFGSQHHLVTIDQMVNQKGTRSEPSGSGPPKPVGWSGPQPIRTLLRATSLLSDVPDAGLETYCSTAEVTADVVPFSRSSSLRQECLPNNPAIYLAGEQAKIWNRKTELSMLIPHKRDDSPIKNSVVRDRINEIEKELKFRFWQEFDLSHEARIATPDDELQNRVEHTIANLLLASDMQLPPPGKNWEGYESHDGFIRLSQLIVDNERGTTGHSDATAPLKTAPLKGVQPLQIVVTHPVGYNDDRVAEYARLVHRAAARLHIRLKSELKGQGYDYDPSSETKAYTPKSGVFTVPEPLAIIAADVSRQFKDTSRILSQRYVAIDWGRRTFDVIVADVAPTEAETGIPLDDGTCFSLKAISCFGLPLGGQTIDYILMAAIAEYLGKSYPDDNRDTMIEKLCRALPMQDSDYTENTKKFDRNDNLNEFVPTGLDRPSQRKIRACILGNRVMNAKHAADGVFTLNGLFAEPETSTDPFAHIFHFRDIDWKLPNAEVAIPIDDLVETRALLGFGQLVISLLKKIINSAGAGNAGNNPVRFLVNGRAAAFAPIQKAIRCAASETRVGEPIIRATEDMEGAKQDVANGAAILARAADYISTPIEPLPCALVEIAPEGSRIRVVAMDLSALLADDKCSIDLDPNATRITLLSGPPGLPDLLAQVFGDRDADTTLSDYSYRLHDLYSAALVGPKNFGGLKWIECDGKESLTIRKLTPDRSLQCRKYEISEIRSIFELPVEGAFLY